MTLLAALAAGPHVMGQANVSIAVTVDTTTPIRGGTAQPPRYIPSPTSANRAWAGRSAPLSALTTQAGLPGLPLTPAGFNTQTFGMAAI